MATDLLEYAIRQTVAPASAALTTDEAKKQVNVVATDDDTLIGTLVKAAIELVERHTNRALITQTWVMTRRMFPSCRQIVLPRAPLQSVTSVTYYDTNNDSQTFNSSNYHVDISREPGVLWLAESSDWPSSVADRPDAVTITYVCGYGDATTDVAERARQAVALLVGHWYRNREAIGNVGQPIALAYHSLIDSLKPGACV